MKIHEACAIIDKQLVKRENLGFVVKPGELEFHEITAGVPENLRLVVPTVGTSPLAFEVVLSSPGRATYIGLLIHETQARIIRVTNRDRQRYDGAINGIWCNHLEYSASVLCTVLYNKNKLKRTTEFLRLSVR